MEASSEYPKAKYRKGESGLESCLVRNAEEEAALDSDWHDFPNLKDRPKPKPVPITQGATDVVSTLKSWAKK